MGMERWRPSPMRAWWPSRATEEMERFADEMLAGGPFRTWRRVPAAELSWSPPLEMYEKEDKFVVRRELPGVNLDEMDILECDPGDDGNNAIAQIAAASPDVVLLDINLPDRSGLDVLDEILQRPAPPPTIMLTA